MSGATWIVKKGWGDGRSWLLSRHFLIPVFRHILTIPRGPREPSGVLTTEPRTHSPLSCHTMLVNSVQSTLPSLNVSYGRV